MRVLYLFFFIILPSTTFASSIFDTDVFELKFQSNNISVTKENKINEIKIKTFNLILKRTLTDNNYKNLSNKLNIKFVNNFVLNMTINDEKIVNNNYFSRIKISYNKQSIIDYFVKNEISFIDRLPNKFLIVVYEENKYENKLFSKKNNYYKFLLNNKKDSTIENLVIPNLDFNDRFILNKNNFYDNQISKIIKLNNKYKTNYAIIIHSQKNNDEYNLQYYLISNFNKYNIGNKQIKNVDYKDIFKKIYHESIDQWKYLNLINTSNINKLVCKININNLYELKFVRDLIKSNSVIKKIDLNSIKLNENIYNIYYFGNFEIFKNSLLQNRLEIFFQENKCIIKII